MKNIAFVFSNGINEKVSNQEGINAALAISSLSEDKIAFFFVNYGIFQLLKQNNSKKNFLKDNSDRFRIFSTCFTKKFYLDLDSIKKRGDFVRDDFFVDVIILNTILFTKKLKNFSFILNF